MAMEMQVGWSAEVSSGVWDKTDIKLDRGDFVLFCKEHNIDESDVSQDEQFYLMEAQAKRYVAAYIQLGHPDLAQECREKIATLDERINGILGKIKQRRLADNTGVEQ